MLWFAPALLWLGRRPPQVVASRAGARRKGPWLVPALLARLRAANGPCTTRTRYMNGLQTPRAWFGRRYRDRLAGEPADEAAWNSQVH